METLPDDVDEMAVVSSDNEVDEVLNYILFVLNFS